MFDLLFITSIIGTFAQLIKESCQPTIPKENWENKEIYYKDVMNNVSEKELMKNLENGKYKLEKKYPEPHRGDDGKIIIENCKLYNDDLRKYGAIQTYKWVEQGKYNLTPEENEKEIERIRKEMEYLYSL